jgi:hypothetical protein
MTGKLIQQMLKCLYFNFLNYTILKISIIIFLEEINLIFLLKIYNLHSCHINLSGSQVTGWEGKNKVSIIWKAKQNKNSNT